MRNRRIREMSLADALCTLVTTNFEPAIVVILEPDAILEVKSGSGSKDGARQCRSRIQRIGERSLEFYARDHQGQACNRSDSFFGCYWEVKYGSVSKDGARQVLSSSRIHQ